MSLDKNHLPLIISALVASGLSDTAEAAAPYNGKPVTEVLISCKQKVMMIMSGKEVLEEVPIQVGKNGCGKEAEGDGKTPVGGYQIKWIVSRDGACGQGEETIEDATWCDENGSILTLGGKAPKNESDPEKLWLPGYGKHGIIMQLDYPNKVDKEWGKTGSCIQIHGSTNMKTPSQGCIKMPDGAALKLCRAVEMRKTPIRIMRDFSWLEKKRR